MSECVGTGNLETLNLSTNIKCSQSVLNSFNGHLWIKHYTKDKSIWRKMWKLGERFKHDQEKLSEKIKKGNTKKKVTCEQTICAYFV